jgi:hypothetical protein
MNQMKMKTYKKRKRKWKMKIKINMYLEFDLYKKSNKISNSRYVKHLIQYFQFQ